MQGSRILPDSGLSMEGPLDSRLYDPFGGDGFIDDIAPERVILRRGLCVRA